MLGLFIFLTVVFGFFLLIYVTKSASRGKRIEALESEIGELGRKLDGAKEELQKVREENSQLRPELNELRSKFKTVKKDLYESDDKIKAAVSRAEEAERGERKAMTEAGRSRDEAATAKAETEKALKSAEALKADVVKLQEKLKEQEKKPRPVEVDTGAADKARAQVQGLQDRIGRLEKKIRQERDDAMERARTTERYRKRLDAVQTAYEVLRGQYNALHDRLLHQMGVEGDAEDGDNLLKTEPEAPAADAGQVKTPVEEGSGGPAA